MGRSEAALQQRILEWLALRGDIVHVRVPVGPVVGRRANGARIRRANPMKGFPDILGIVPGGAGRIFAIEVKDPGGDFSQEQVLWRERIIGAGGLYVCARTLEAPILALRSGQCIPE